MSSAPVAAHVIVHGRVQGVFFRACTAEQAARLAISGWVRNLPDGTVEAHFEGPHDAVGQILTWCETGSPQAEVTRIERINTSPEGISGFEIRR